jgi:hypothetical protein
LAMDRSESASMPSSIIHAAQKEETAGVLTFMSWL